MLVSSQNGLGFPHTSSSEAVVCGKRKGLDIAADGDDPALQEVVERQRKVLNSKRDAAVEGRCAPNPYVDAKGGRMKLQDDHKAAVTGSEATVPMLPLRPILKRSASMERCKVPQKFIHMQTGQLPDVVCVSNPAAETPEALMARLLGARLVNYSWLCHHDAAGPLPADARCLAFRRAVDKMRYTFYLSPSFLKEYPRHVEVLQFCANFSGLVKVRGQKVPRFDIKTTPMPEDLDHPAHTFQLVGTSDELQGESLSKLFFKVTSLYEGYENA